MSFTSSIHIGTYSKRLLLQHTGYIIALIFFLILAVLFIPVQIRDYQTVKAELQTLNATIQDLSKRRGVIQEYPQEKLDDLVTVLNTIYPSQEDKFSIFSALDALASVSGMQIITYSSPFAGKSLHEVVIAVRARASEPAFRLFLRNHVFRSGRFMTIDKITYDVESGTVDFTAKFHSSPVEIGSQTASQYSPEGITRLREIQKEVESVGYIRKPVDQQESISTEYSTKDNPFE
jgi:hypothetical protein